MARTIDPNAGTVDDAVWLLTHDKKRSPVVALGIVALTLVAAAIAVFLSYQGVPAPQNPANARPHLVEPYQ